MENTDLILVNEKEAYLENRRRRTIHLGRVAMKAWSLIMAVGILICAIWLFPHTKELLKSVNFKNIFSQADNEIQGGSGSQNDKLPSAQKPPEASTKPSTGEAETIPSDAYKIEASVSQYKITNESKINLEITEPTLISPSEIRLKYGSEAPLVLITHFSPRESYSNGKYYKQTDDFYSEENNVGALAEAMTENLNALGIKTLYLNEEYAKGSIFGTLEEYKSSLKSVLEQYPSISYVFCLSRGIYIGDGMVQKREAVSSGEEKCAQIRIISGTNGDKLSQTQAKNVNFALDFAKFANEKIENFVAESKLAQFPLGQSVQRDNGGAAPLSLEIELGTYANTFKDASSSAMELSRLISQYLSLHDTENG